MLCMMCGAEMRLVEVTEDTTMLVSGHEHHTWQCSGCSTIERRLTFTREKTLTQALPVVSNQTVPLNPIHTIPVNPSQTVPIETTEAVPLAPTPTAPAETKVAVQAETLPVEATHQEPLQTNASWSTWSRGFNEKLWNLKARATALREAAGETERRAQFNRVWDNLRSIPSPCISSDGLSDVKSDEPDS
jgi:hypothetical protein